MDRKKIQEICDSLTNREKAVIVSMQWMRGNQENPLEKYGIPKFYTADSPKGMDYVPEDDEKWAATDDHNVTYLSAAAQASSWNKEYLRELGERMGVAAKGRGVHSIFRPAINIKRYTLNGRNFEYFTEDPVLAGELAAAFISGIQSKGIVSAVKHYAVNSQEFERMSTNAVVSERALREIYLRGFQIAIEKGHPRALMTSYNKVNGHYVNDNEHLMNILRKEWGFDGYITSDAGAVQEEIVANAHRNSMDFELGGAHVAELQNALDRGEISQEAVDNNIRRMIEAYEYVRSVTISEKEDRDDDHAFARRFAADSLVLLKNEDGTLPLEKNADIAVIGAFAKVCHPVGGGSAFTNCYIKEYPLPEMEKITGTAIPYAEAYVIGHDPDDEKEADPRLIVEAVKLAKNAETVIFFCGLPYPYESEGWDRRTFDLPKGQIEALKAVIEVNPNVVLVNTAGCAVNLLPFMDAKAILQNFLSGEAAGGAIADVLFGEAEPGGRLSETLPVRIEDTPAYLYTPIYPVMNPDVWYGEDIFVGYRYYEKKKVPVLFPFGHGLGYTAFSYHDLKTDVSETTPDGTVTVSVKVKNTGSRRGSAVLQFYVRPVVTHAIRPEKELKEFAKVTLDPGEEKTVSVTLDRKAFEYFSDQQNRWVVENGKYDILLGESSEKIADSTQIMVHSDERSVMFHDRIPQEWVYRDKNRAEALGKVEGLSETLKSRLDPDRKAFSFGPKLYAEPQLLYHVKDERGMFAPSSGNERSFYTDSELSALTANLNSFRENE